MTPQLTVLEMKHASFPLTPEKPKRSTLHPERPVVCGACRLFCGFGKISNCGNMVSAQTRTTDCDKAAPREPGKPIDLW